MADVRYGIRCYLDGEKPSLVSRYGMLAIYEERERAVDFMKSLRKRFSKKWSKRAFGKIKYRLVRFTTYFKRVDGNES